MKIVKFSFLTIISLIFIAFCVVNRAVVSISLFPIPYSFEAPVFVLALASMLIGVITTGFVMNIKSIKTQSALRTAKKRAEAMENENRSLRSEREQSYTALPKQL